MLVLSRKIASMLDDADDPETSFVLLIDPARLTGPVEVTVKIIEFTKGKYCRVGITAPRSVEVARAEIVDRFRNGDR